MEDKDRDFVASRVVAFLATKDGNFGPNLEAEVAAIIEGAMADKDIVFYHP